MSKESIHRDRNPIEGEGGEKEARKNVRSLSHHSAQNFRRAPENSAVAGSEHERIPGRFRRSEISDVALSSLRPVPLFRSDGNVGRRPNCVTLAGVSRRASRKFERAKPGGGKGSKWNRRETGGGVGRCLDSVENTVGYAGEGAGTDRRQSEVT